MKTIQEIFKVFQHGEEFFQILNEKKLVKKFLLTQILLIFVFCFLYGIVMGSYNGVLQSLVTALKLPILIFLSLIICFPALYVIQFMIGSKMTIAQMANIILSGFIVFSTIALSFSPIVIFFMITGDNYGFLKLLHVAIFVFAGIFGMKTILAGLQYSCEKQNLYPRLGIKVFRMWIFIFAFVSAQLSWNLRPFLGSRELGFELFREKKGNFYLAVINSAMDMVEPEK